MKKDSPLEKEVVAKLRKGLRGRGAMVVKPLYPWNRGFPDLMVIEANRPIYFIEAKRLGATLTPNQEACIHALFMMGVSTYLVEGLEGVDLFLANRLAPYEGK